MIAYQGGCSALSPELEAARIDGLEGPLFEEIGEYLVAAGVNEHLDLVCEELVLLGTLAGRVALGLVHHHLAPPLALLADLREFVDVRLHRGVGSAAHHDVGKSKDELVGVLQLCGLGRRLGGDALG